MIPLFKPYMPELPEIDAILHSGALAYGNYTKQFEEKLRDYFSTPYLIVTNSFSSAISVALTTLGIGPGDDVVASPMACLVSTQPYLSSGLNVRWADVDPHTGTLSPDSVRQQIKSSTKAIIHNHFCGYPGFVDEINEIGARFGIPVIDDGIECFGTEYKGKKIGNCGTDVTLFSLSAVRFCNCIDGGIVIFKDVKHFQKSLLIRDSGINRSTFRDNMGEIRQDSDISLIGFNATMSNINGYIGLRQMTVIDDLLHKHRKQAEKWHSIYDKQSTMIPIDRDGCNPNYWVFGLLTDNKVESIMKLREMGYYASGVHMRNDFYSVFGKQEVALPGVDQFYKGFIALPCGWWMDND